MGSNETERLKQRIAELEAAGERAVVRYSEVVDKFTRGTLERDALAARVKELEAYLDRVKTTRDAYGDEIDVQHVRLAELEVERHELELDVKLYRDNFDTVIEERNTAEATLAAVRILLEPYKGIQHVDVHEGDEFVTGTLNSDPWGGAR